MKKIVLFFIFLICFAQCKDKAKRVIDKNRNVTSLEKDDPQFLALKDTAQKYIDTFIRSLQKTSTDTGYAHLIKSDFSEGDTHEHMWSVAVNFSNGSFKCVFDDSAFSIHAVHRGDTIFVRKNEVEDWAIYDNVHKQKTGYFSEKYLTGQE